MKRTVVEIIRESRPAVPAEPEVLVADHGIIGWRAWCVSGDKLESVIWPVKWFPGDAMMLMDAPPPPDNGNRAIYTIMTPNWCPERAGVYAFDDYKHVCRFMRDCFVSSLGDVVIGVIGQVRLWGRVHIHERGYRAEYAYPHRLWSTGPLADYGVPTTVFGTVEECLAAAAAQGRKDEHR